MSTRPVDRRVLIHRRPAARLFTRIVVIVRVLGRLGLIVYQLVGLNRRGVLRRCSVLGGLRVLSQPGRWLVGGRCLVRIYLSSICVKPGNQRRGKGHFLLQRRSCHGIAARHGSAVRLSRTRVGVAPLSRLAVLKVWSSIRLTLQIVARLRRLFVVTAEVVRGR